MSRRFPPRGALALFSPPLAWTSEVERLLPPLPHLPPPSTHPLPHPYFLIVFASLVSSSGRNNLQILGRGRIIECSVCGNKWFQTAERALTLTENFLMKVRHGQRAVAEKRGKGETHDRGKTLLTGMA